MDDQKINRAIAEFLEPFDGKPWRALHLRSPKGCWVWPYNNSPGDIEPASARHWQPRDFLHDPACTVMLLEKLLRRGYCVAGMYWNHSDGEWTGVAVHHKEDNGGDEVVAETLGRAVALAFCRANGLNLEE